MGGHGALIRKETWSRAGRDYPGRPSAGCGHGGGRWVGRARVPCDLSGGRAVDRTSPGSVAVPPQGACRPRCSDETVLACSWPRARLGVGRAWQQTLGMCGTSAHPSQLCNERVQCSAGILMQKQSRNTSSSGNSSVLTVLATPVQGLHHARIHAQLVV